MGMSINGVKYDCDVFFVYYFGFVFKSLLKFISVNFEKGGNNGKYIFVFDVGESGVFFVREVIVVVVSCISVVGGFEFELVDVKYGGENLVNFGNIVFWEFKFF